MHAAAAPTRASRAQKEALHGCTRAAFTAASASIIIAMHSLFPGYGRVENKASRAMPPIW